MEAQDADDIQFAARLVLDGFMDEAFMKRVLATQAELCEKGKPLTVPQICVKKGWLTRSEVRFMLAPENPPAQLIPGYEIVGHLGSGAMSQVYRAVDADGDEVALKVLKPHVARNERDAERFRREMALLMKLNHENIVSGYDLIEADGMVAGALELVPGMELLALLVQSGPFQEDAALYVVLQTAKALKAMYALGIVHRDIKPANVLITPDNTVKLCDLGLALSGVDDLSEGTTVGTVEYISPEQAMGDNSVDVRSDIYALGVTLYHLVVGETPFQGDDAFDTMAKRFSETLQSKNLSKLSPHMDYFIQKMMAQDKSIRYQSPDELIDDIEESIRGKKTLTVNPMAAKAGNLELGRPFEKKAPSKAPVSRRNSAAGKRRRRR